MDELMDVAMHIQPVQTPGENYYWLCEHVYQPTSTQQACGRGMTTKIDETYYGNIVSGVCTLD